MVWRAGQLPVRHILDRMQGRRGAGNVHEALLEAFVREQILISRIRHANAVDDEVVGIQVRFHRADHDAPHAVGVRGERLVRFEELRAQLHLLRIRRTDAEGHRAIGVDYWRVQWRRAIALGNSHRTSTDQANGDSKEAGSHRLLGRCGFVAVIDGFLDERGDAARIFLMGDMAAGEGANSPATSHSALPALVGLGAFLG